MTINAYEEFKKKVLMTVKSKYPYHQVSIGTSVGINRIKEGLIIEREDGVSPSICLQELYENYECTGDFDELMEFIDYVYKMPSPKVDRGTMLSWEESKTKIYPVLVNKERNISALSRAEVVFQEFLDLLIIYCLEINLPDGKASVKITQFMLKAWGISEEQLKVQCFANEKYEISNFAGMYILTNEDNYRGSAGMVFSNKLKEFADDMESDIYMLPSSTHELILLEKDDNLYSVEELKRMVVEINSDTSIISAEDYLSDSVYVYQRDCHEIKLAA